MNQTNPTALALLRDAESYLSALHVHVARHDNIGAGYACGGCMLRDRIAAALPTLAVVSPPPDRAALRDRIAEVLWPLTDWDGDQLNAEAAADAVLAVLPEPDQADEFELRSTTELRADVLREAADIAESLRQFEPAAGARKAAQVSENVGILRVAALLRRLAVEAGARRADEPIARPTRYVVNLVPETAAPDAHIFEISVEWRGDDRWAVLRHGWCLGSNGEWDYELRPSEREDEWLEVHRFDLDTALRLAKEQAPLVTVNGITAADVLKRLTDEEPRP